MHVDNQRYDININPHPSGKNFITDDGLLDLYDMNIISSGVDTIRQHFSGVPKTQIIDIFENLTFDGSNLISIPFDYNSSRMQTFHITKMGKNSGYKYKLQNNDIGIIILFRSFYNKENKKANHMKIELSHKFIHHNKPKYIDETILKLSQYFLDDSEYHSIAIHLYSDVQNMPDNNHISKFKCKSRIIREYHSEKIEFDNIHNINSSYGGTDTLMIGSASGLQLTVYNKSKEIIKTDKYDYMQNVWNQDSVGSYDKTIKVTRIETRLHHSVINQFSAGIGKSLKNYTQVYNYLYSIWHYSLTHITKMMTNGKNGYISPDWQIILQDTKFGKTELKEFKRSYKRDSVAPIAKNIGMLIGNYLTIRSRQKIKFDKVFSEILKILPKKELLKYVEDKNLNLELYKSSLRHVYIKRLMIKVS